MFPTDEVQNFTHDIDFPTILAGLRKHALGLVIGTQTLAGLLESTGRALSERAGRLEVSALAAKMPRSLYGNSASTVQVHEARNKLSIS